jgi:hypothetical protein
VQPASLSEHSWAHPPRQTGTLVRALLLVFFRANLCSSDSYRPCFAAVPAPSPADSDAVTYPPPRPPWLVNPLHSRATPYQHAAYTQQYYQQGAYQAYQQYAAQQPQQHYAAPAASTPASSDVATHDAVSVSHWI